MEFLGNLLQTIFRKLVIIVVPISVAVRVCFCVCVCVFLFSYIFVYSRIARIISYRPTRCLNLRDNRPTRLMVEGAKGIGIGFTSYKTASNIFLHVNECSM